MGGNLSCRKEIEQKPSGNVIKDIMRSKSLTLGQRQEMLALILDRFPVSYEAKFGDTTVDEILEDYFVKHDEVAVGNFVGNRMPLALIHLNKMKQTDQELLKLLDTIKKSQISEKQKKKLCKKFKKEHPKVYKKWTKLDLVLEQKESESPGSDEGEIVSVNKESSGSGSSSRVEVTSTRVEVAVEVSG